MIWESRYWKDDLLKAASYLRQKREQKRWLPVSLARLEQRIVLGFYGIRKLQESRKISDRFRHRPVLLNEFYPTGKMIKYYRRDELDEIYKMGSPRMTKKPLNFVCNQIIHSYVFTPGLNEDAYLEDLYFASERQKNKSMFGIKIDEIASIFEEVGNNYPTYFYWHYDRTQNREVIRVTDEFVPPPSTEHEDEFFA
jgi:hypothetical protein